MGSPDLQVLEFHARKATASFLSVLISHFVFLLLPATNMTKSDGHRPITVLHVHGRRRRDYFSTLFSTLNVQEWVTSGYYFYQCRHTCLLCLPVTTHPADMHTSDDTPACYAYRWRHTGLICLSVTAHLVVMVVNDDTLGWYANQWRYTRLLLAPVTTGPVDVLTSDEIPSCSGYQWWHTRITMVTINVERDCMLYE